ncbi:glycosyltransferase family 4 protein [Candidatus Pantoea formicae]|uniref:glycosyltransferase family 4 protein n=1 Tax=Candidatus Pantoea formicae TaxID=2608355 RepID=UPI003EDB1A98
MRILYFVNTAWYFDLHWIDRVNKLVIEGHEVHLVTTFSDNRIKEKIEAKGIECWDLNIDRFSINLVSNAKLLIEFHKLIKKIKPDLIHTITIKPNIIGGFIARMNKVPQIISIVGLGRVFLSDNYLKKLIGLFYKAILFNNDNIQMIFEHAADKTAILNMSNISPGKLHVIDGAGIDVEQFPYYPEKCGTTTNILFASRLLKAKGLELLVESVRQLKNEGLPLELLVAGISDDEDPDKIPIDLIEEWSSRELIVWLGKRNDVDALLKNCNIMVLPTKYAEGIPRIILEACSIGRACVVGNMPGCQSVISDKINGMVLKKHSVDELKECLRFLVENPDVRKEFGIRSSQLIKDKFSKDIVINKTFQVYKQALINKDLI